MTCGTLFGGVGRKQKLQEELHSGGENVWATEEQTKKAKPF